MVWPRVVVAALILFVVAVEHVVKDGAAGIVKVE
jgi:hypothetical protein